MEAFWAWLGTVLFIPESSTVEMDLVSVVTSGARTLVSRPPSKLQEWGWGWDPQRKEKCLMDINIRRPPKMDIQDRDQWPFCPGL